MIQFCAYCGKAFQVFGGVWGYAYGGMYTCSYKCMRAMKEEDSVTEEQKRIVDELEGKGLTAQEIAAKAGTGWSIKRCLAIMCCSMNITIFARAAEGR